MDILNWLKQFDQNLFLAINHLPHPPFLNFVFLFFSAAGTLGILWFFLGLVVFLWEELKERNLLFKQAVAGFLSLLCVKAGKIFFARPRPEFSLPGVWTGGRFSDDFSFPSGHTTFAFAMAFLFAQKYPRKKFFFYLLASLIAFSRIYLGKHYPLDCLAGLFLGIFLGKITTAIPTPGVG